MIKISTPYYKIIDFLLIFLCCSIAYQLRFGTFFIPDYYLPPTIFFAAISTPSLVITNFYQETNSNLSAQLVASAIAGLVVSAILTIVCLYLTKTGQDYSRVWLVTSVLIAFIALIAVRFILKHVFNVSSNPRVIVLLGSDYSAEEAKANLVSSKSDGITIAKHFTLPRYDRNSLEQRISDVVTFIEEYRKNNAEINPISEVWITHDVFSKLSHISLVTALENSCVSLVYIPALPKTTSFNDEQIRLIAGVPTINSGFSKNEKLKQFIKFIEDQLIAWTALILLSPLLVIVSLSIKLSSPGPIFYKQLRYGFGGKSFMIWKFRTMHVNPNQEFKQAQKDDPRITNVGKFLRRSSIDELPQLINVIKGSMSIVGPRPHPEALNEQYRDDIFRYMRRHSTKPGITGLAQIRGYRGETETPNLMQKRIESDLEYVESWSISLDIKIILFTIFHLIATDKAY